MPNYYFVLGVSPDANVSQIKRAYRKLCQRYHPDHAGQESVERFHAIKEAYDALSQTTRRDEHDRKLDVEQRRRGLGTRPASARPLRRPMNPFADFANCSPSFGELFDVFTRNFTHRHVPKSQPVRNVTLEVILTPQEARRGGHVPLEIPIAEVCPICQGAGQAGFSVRDDCEGHGMTWEMRQIDVLLPSGTQDGTTVPVSLRHLGITNMQLTLLIRVAGPMSYV